MITQSGRLDVVGMYGMMRNACMRWKLTCFLRYSWLHGLPIARRNIYTHIGLAVPARFVEHLTSSDVETPEDSDVSLRCVASGLPLPEIKWRREDGQTINIQGERGREKGLLFYPNLLPFFPLLVLLHFFISFSFSTLVT